MSDITIKLASTGERNGYIIAAIAPEDAFHTGSALVAGTFYRISPDGEPEEWRAWLYPAAGGWAHITQSCEAMDSQSTGLLRRRLQKRVDKDGAWWK